jgi:hypothetical protein
MNESGKEFLAVGMMLFGLGLGSIFAAYYIKRKILVNDSEKNKESIDEAYNQGAIETHNNFKQLLKWAAMNGTDAYALLYIVEQTEKSLNKKQN